MGKNLLADLVTRRSVDDDRYQVAIHFEDHVLGGQPLNPEVLRGWLESKHADPEHLSAQLDVMPTDVAVDSEERKSSTGFMTDAAEPGGIGIFIGTYQVQAMIKEMASALGITTSRKGSKQTGQHLVEVVACDPEFVAFAGKQARRLRLYRGGQIVTEPDDYVELCAHVTSAQGQRAVLKRHQTVRGASTYFVIRTPADLTSREKAVLREEELLRILAYAQNNGLGCSRSQGFGKFMIVGLEKIDGAKKVKTPKEAAATEDDG